jgi:hypothetical protein
MKMLARKGGFAGRREATFDPSVQGVRRNAKRSLT